MFKDCRQREGASADWLLRAIWSSMHVGLVMYNRLISAQGHIQDEVITCAGWFGQPCSADELSWYVLLEWVSY